MSPRSSTPEHLPDARDATRPQGAHQPGVRLHVTAVQSARQPKQRQQPNALFADIGLRRAITMALDRARLVRSQFDSLGTVGRGTDDARPAARGHHRRADSLRLRGRRPTARFVRLDAAGRKTVRERNGQPLRFKILTPSVSTNRMRMVVKVQEALRRIGRGRRRRRGRRQHVPRSGCGQRDFDVAFNGRRAGPERRRASLRIGPSRAARRPERAELRRATRIRDSTRISTARSRRVDMATRALTRARRTRRWPPTCQQSGSTKRERPPSCTSGSGPRTSCPTAWWAGIADWSIPHGERIPRDRGGLKVASRAGEGPPALGVRRFLARRLAHGAAVIFIAASLSFLLVHLAPGDPFSATLDSVTLDPAVEAHGAIEYGLDRPLPEQYVRFLGQLATGNLGPSLPQRPPAWPTCSPPLRQDDAAHGNGARFEHCGGDRLGAWQATRRGTRRTELRARLR